MQNAKCKIADETVTDIKKATIYTIKSTNKRTPASTETGEIF